MQIKIVKEHDYKVYRDLTLAELKDLPHPVHNLIEEKHNQPLEYWKEATISRCALHILFIAEVDNEIVGCVYGLRSSESETKGRLTGIWVSSHYRRRYYGFALLERFLNWAESVGNSEVILWVDENNSVAIKLYVESGFRRTGKEINLTESDLKTVEMTTLLDRRQ